MSGVMREPADNWNAQRKRLAAAMPAMRTRSAVLQAIRKFFTSRDFIEVESPVRVSAPILEAHIDAEPSGDKYLRTSPELHMKKLLAAGYKRIFQMGPCFRRDEKGRLHNPEYTMLEWYRAGSDYRDLLADIKALIMFVAGEATGGTILRWGGEEIDLSGPWEYVTVANAFMRHAGWNPVEKPDPDRFDEDMAVKVEPALSRHCPVILADYPAHAAALARMKADGSAVAERWELYIGGVELVNAFSELNEPAEQGTRLRECALARKTAGKDVYPVDDSFLSALEDMPASAGAALGVDRLVMLLAGAPTLDAVLPFREPIGGKEG